MKAVTAALAALGIVLIASPTAAAQSGCVRVAILTLPSVTWGDVRHYRPPRILDAAADGSIGSISVRTIFSRTTPASGFASLGAGARVEGGARTGGPAEEVVTDFFARDVLVGGLEDIREQLDAAGYSAVTPGALGEALDDRVVAAVGNADLGASPPTIVGYGRWPLLAAMDASGRVDLAAVGSPLLRVAPTAPFGVRTDPAAASVAVREALEDECAVAVVDHGDLGRVDALEALEGDRLSEERGRALAATDELLGEIRSVLDDRDLLLIVSPTAPSWDDDDHFGVAIAVGPGFPRGTTLTSSSTGRPGMVTLPDVAPTVLEQLGIKRPGSMLGRTMFAESTDASDRIASAVDLDAESVFVDRARTAVSTAFVIFQVLIFLLLVPLLFAGKRRGRLEGRRGLLLEIAALSVIAFPVSTYLMGFLEQHSLGGVWFAALLIGMDAALVAVSYVVLSFGLDRVLALTAFTMLTLMADTILGAPLQLRSVFGYSPLVAGRFSGVGNIAFSVLAASSLITGTLIVHRWSGSRRALAAAGALFAATVIVDGTPQFGADVGGVIALIPGFAIAWLLLARKRVTWKLVAVSVAVMLVAVGVFLAIDLARPEESRTHLARLFEDVRDRGVEVLTNTLDRKVTTNLRVFRSTIWTYLVPPALASMAWLLMRPRGRWGRLANAYPRLRGGLVAGLVIAVIGFAVNDSGIVIPAVILSFLAPLALMVHLSMEPEGPAPELGR